jgi:hypothetical protein
MKRFNTDYNGITLAQVNVTKAKRLYKEGVTVYLIQSNACTNSPWIKPHELKADVGSGRITRAIDFDGVVTAYRYYNCNSELGQRVHFLVDIKSL